MMAKILIWNESFFIGFNLFQQRSDKIKAELSSMNLFFNDQINGLNVPQKTVKR